MPIIDHEVVAMEFDNENFQANMRETEESIKNFEHELSIIADKETLSEIGTVAIRVTENFEPLKTALDTIVETLMNNLIGAINKVKAAIDQVTLDPITQGFDKYEEKINAVQTIMNATGMTIDEVEERLDKLAWFTDETSYSFTEMTATLGKFTSAGVGLDDAMTSMIGIANWAGTAGVNAKTANRAFYNLSQAIGSGAIKLQDWASIENVNMNTADFQQTVIDTAKDMVKFGETYGSIVKKYGENSQQLADEVKKNGHTMEQARTYMEYFAEGISPKDVGWEGITSSNFRGTLASGWFTKSVFLETMKKYGDFTEQIYNFQNEAGIDTASEAMNTYAENFSDVMDKLYEAYQKFGKESEEFQAIVKENGIGLQTALDFVSVKEAQLYNENLQSIADTLKKTADEFGIESDEFAQAAKDAGYSVSDGAEMVLNGIKKFEKAEKSRGEIGFRSAQEARTFTDAWGSAIEATSSQWQAFWQKIFGNYEEAAVMWTELANTLWDVFAGPIASLNEIMDTVIELGARINIIGDDDATYGIRKAWNELLKVLEPVKQAFADVFTMFKTDENGEYSGIINFIYNLTLRFKEWTEQLNTSGKTLYEIRATAEKFFETIKAVGEVIGSIFGNAWRIVKAFVPSFSEILSFFSEFSSELGSVDSVGRSVAEKITSFTDKILEKVLLLRAVLYIVFQALREAIPVVIAAIGLAVTTIYSYISPYIERILAFIPVVKEAIAGVATFIFSIAVEIGGNLVKIASSIISYLSTTLEIGGALASTAATAAKSIFPFETLGKLVELLRPAFTVLLKVIGYIGDAFAKFISNINIARAGLIALVSTSLISSGSIGMFFYDTFFNVINFLKGLLNPVANLKDLLSGFFEVFRGFMESFMENSWLEAVTKLIRSFAISVLILAGAAVIFSAIDANNLAASIGGMVGAISTLIGTVYAFSKMSTIADMKGMIAITAVIVAFASALFTLSAAMLNIGTVFGKFGLGGILSAIGGVIVATAALVVALKFFVDMTKEIGAFTGFASKMNAIGKILQKLAFSILIISFAVKIIGSMKPLEALQGILAILVIMEGFALFIQEMTKYTENAKKIVKLTSSLVILAIAINLLVIPIELLGHMKFWQMIQGLLGIAGIMLGFYVFTKALVSIDSKTLAKNLFSVAGSMVIFALAINMLMIPIELMGHMQLDQLAKGLGGIAILMAIFYVFDRFADRIKAGALNLIGIATSMILMAAALTILMIPVELMAHMQLGQLAKGLGGIAVLLLELGAFAFAVSKVVNMGTAIKLVILSTAMVLIGASMTLFGSAVQKIGSMPFKDWLKGLIGIALIMTEVVAFAVALQTFVKGGAITFTIISVGMVALAYGLDKMADVLQKIGNMDFGVLFKGFLGIAAILAGMVLLASLLSGFTPKLLLFSVGVAAVGASLYILGMGIDAVHTAFYNIANDEYIREFADMLVEAVGGGVEGVVALLEDFGSKWNTFWEGFGAYVYDELHDENGNNKIGVAIAEWFSNIQLPDITQTEFYKYWSAGIDTMRSDISNFFTNFKETWKNRFENLKTVVSTAWTDFSSTWKQGFNTLTQPIRDFGNFWYTTFEGTGKEIFRIQKEYWEPGVEAIKDFFLDIGKVVGIFFDMLIADWKEGWNVWKTGFDEIWANWSLGWETIKTDISNKITAITDNVKTAFTNWNTFFEGAGAEFYELNSAGWNEIEDAIQGVVDKFNAFVETWTTGWDEIKGGWDEFWGNWGTGWNEIQNGWNNFWSPEQGKKDGTNYANAQIKGYEDAYEIHSPSKRTEYEGKMKTEGEANGLTDPEAQKHLKDAAEENAEIISTAYKKGSANDQKEQLMHTKETVDETKKTVEKEAEKVDLKKSLTDKVYGWINDASFLNEDQKKWVKEKFDAFVGGINFDGLALPDINSLFEDFTGGLEVPEAPELDLSKWEDSVSGLGDGVDLSGLTNELDTSTLSANNLSDSVAGLNGNLANTGDIANSLSLSDIFGTSDLATKAEAEGAAIGDGIKTGITDSTRKLTYNDIIHRNAIMRAAQKDGIWSESFDKALKAAGYTDDFYSTADRLKIYNEARATRTANFSDRINIKDSAELYRLITTLNNNGVMSDEFENALRSYYGDDYKELTAKEKNDLVASLTDAYAKEEEFIANNYEAILKAYESGTGTAAFKEMFNLQGSDDRDLKDFIDRTKAYKNYQDRLQNESEKQGKDIKTMSEVVTAFNQVIDTDGVKVTMAKAKTDVLESALKVIESSTQKDGVKKNSLEYVQALDQLNWSYEDAEQYLKLKAEEEKKKAGGTTATQQKTTTSSTSETKANTTSTYNPVTTVKADNVTVDTKNTTATAQTSTQVAGDITGYIKDGVQKLTNIDATITLMNTKIDQMAETIVVMNETALNELALLNGWKGESGDHNAAVAVRLANIQNRGVPIANRASFMQEVAEATDTYLGNKVTRRVRGN